MKRTRLYLATPKSGSGKSTLVSFIIAALGINQADIAYVAYTGKAAQVLRQKGCENAITAHKLLYDSYLNKKTGKFRHVPKIALDEPYKLIVVDEVSMLPDEMWKLLLSHHVHVIALGDPAQLPPVGSNKSNALDHPHVFLDEIMRQAQESDIIRLTMDIRDGKPLELYRGTDVRVIDAEEFYNTKVLDWADQILIAKNKTRFAINEIMRKRTHNAQSNFPIEGDRIICLNNNWGFMNEDGDSLTNGLTGTISNISSGNPKEDPFTESFIYADFTPDWDGASTFYHIKMDTMIFTDHRGSLNKIHPNSVIPMDYVPEQFDYGYGITVWKAQGSEYDKVLFIPERIKNQSKEDYIKFLYTGATRASKKLVIVKDLMI